MSNLAKNRCLTDFLLSFLLRFYARHGYHSALNSISLVEPSSLLPVPYFLNKYCTGEDVGVVVAAIEDYALAWGDGFDVILKDNPYKLRF